MTINMYREHEREGRSKSYDEYKASPDFRTIEAEALARGYRHATLSEIEASADSQNGAVDLFCWRGGLWVKVGAA